MNKISILNANDIFNYDITSDNFIKRFKTE